MALTKVEAEQLQAAQTNITSVGTLTGLTVNANTLTLNGTDPLINLQNGGSNHWQLGFENTQSDRFVIYDNNATSYRLIIDSSGNTTFAGTVASTKFIADQFTSASGDVTFRRGGSSTARLLIESGTTTSGQNFTVSGTTTATTFTDGYVTWNLAQFNRYGAAIELQYAPTNSATLVKIGANGSNPTVFNAYTGAASFSGLVHLDGSGTAERLRISRGTDDSGQFTDFQYNHIELNRSNVALASAQTPLSILQRGSDGVRTVFHVHTDGKVGIGTVTPATHLHVYDSTSHAEVRVGTSGSSDAKVPAFSINNTAVEWSIATKSDNHLHFRENTASYATRMVVADGGNVGIGESNPARRLSVRRDTGITAGFNDISQFLDTTLGAGGSVSLNLGRANSTKNLGKMAFKYAGSGNNSNALNFGFYDADNLMTLTAAGKFSVGHAAPFSKFQVGSHTFSGSNGMYTDSRVGMSNHGFLTGLMLATTYNDSNYPDYGLVFVAGPSTSSYNCWNIAPDGPAKGNRLNFHYQAQSSNIHVAPRMASLDGSGNFYPAGDVVMAQGKGIQFVNQADFATGETVVSSILDDYEEGRFDPYIGGSSNVGTWTSNNANGGYYIKVGRMVQVWINATGSLSGASGYMRLFGLPFVCASNIAAHAFNAVYSSGSLQYWSGSGADVMGPLTYPSTRYLYFHTYNGSSTGGQPAVTNGGHNLHCCAVYYTS